MAPRYDVDQLKQLANGRWPELLGLDSDISNKRKRPCPKCGGTDRFRALNDFDETGAVICSQCFNSKNGDGIATYAWLTSCANGEAICQLAEKLELDPIAKAKAKAKGKRKSKAEPSQSPASQFKWSAWNESLASLFCSRKQGIVPSSLVECGARAGSHYGTPVFALPVRDESGNSIGFTAANATGAKMVIQYPDGETEKTSWRNFFAKGCNGIIGTNNLFDADARGELTRIYKMEGPSDLLAIVPFLQPGEGAFCNASGANERPEKFEWLLKWLDGRQVIVIHDRDKAGVDGALGNAERNKQGWATWAAEVAREVRNLELPYPLLDSHGSDFRQWVIDGATLENLTSLVESAEIISPFVFSVLEDGADPHYLATVNLNQYQQKHGRKLVYWKSEWYRWKAGVYLKIDDTELKSKITAAIRQEFECQWREEFADYNAKKSAPDFDHDKDKGPPKVKKVTPQLVTSVVSAMASMVQLPGTVVMPSWLEDRTKRHYVSMQNGILDFDKVFAGADISDFLLPQSPNWFSQFQLSYKFDWDSKCPSWLQYLNYSLEGDQERIDVLQEWAGYLLTTTNYLQKFLVLEGGGGNGKTVFFAAIRAMLGSENVSSVPLERFGGRFDLSTTIGKAANICGDVGEIDAVCEGSLKQFTGGDVMTFDRKNKQPLEIAPTAKLMMAWNLRPRFKDRSSGVWRRMLLVPFNREIEESRKITGMDNFEWWLSSGEVPAILRWAIEGLDRLQTVGKFTRPAISEDAAESYRQESNPAREFLFEHLNENLESRIPCQWLYEMYCHWCRQTGHSFPLANAQFGKEIARAFPKSERKMLKPTSLTEATNADRDRVWHYSGVEFSVDYILGRSIHERDY